MTLFGQSIRQLFPPALTRVIPLPQLRLSTNMSSWPDNERDHWRGH